MAESLALQVLKHIGVIQFVDRRKTVVHGVEPVDVTTIAMIEGVGEGGEIASKQTRFHFHVVNVVFSLFSLGSLSAWFLKLCFL